MVKNDAGDAAPIRARMSEFLGFVKTARAFKGDLSALTTPSFLLSEKSFVEAPVWGAQPPSIFTAPTLASDPIHRSLAVLKWFVVTRNGERTPVKRKPLNPFLGEFFLATLDEADSGHTDIVAECVSHHPPVVAYQVTNKAHGVTLQGYSRSKMTLSTSLCIEDIGHTVLHFSHHDEHYLITRPQMFLSGILPPWTMEMEGKCYIVGSNSIIIQVEFSNRSWYGRGTNHSFTARAYYAETPDQPLYTAQGTWKPENYTVHDGATGEVLEVFKPEPNDIQLATIKVKPLTEQHPLETRRAWRPVVEAIEAGDYSRATAEKSKIEETQRAARRRELADGDVWKTRYFQPGDEAPAQQLLAHVGVNLRADETKGVWRWAALED